MTLEKQTSTSAESEVKLLNHISDKNTMRSGFSLPKQKLTGIRFSTGKFRGNWNVFLRTSS